MSDPIDVRSDEMIASRRSDTIDLPSDMPEWMQKTIRRIDGFSIRVGEIIAWLTLPLMLAMAYEIFVRYAFTAPTDWAYDISRMLYGAMFMIGAGYALQKRRAYSLRLSLPQLVCAYPGHGGHHHVCLSFSAGHADCHFGVDRMGMEGN